MKLTQEQLDALTVYAEMNHAGTSLGRVLALRALFPELWCLTLRNRTALIDGRETNDALELEAAAVRLEQERLMRLRRGVRE